MAPYSCPHHSISCFDGALGMDFLQCCKAVISVADAMIYFKEKKTDKA